ncbi:PEP-utilizing enzyme [Minwuia sp.]|uniref:PEP-utilizing enzyme n=1 Tax=Minwuia sp. TaxID=2493630 RepID=UPI003A906739
MFQFSTKAQTLEDLKAHLKNASIVPQVHFSVEAWRTGRADLLDTIRETFAERTLIVRSSCQREDSEHASNAGAFLSLLDVAAGNVADAIEAVIDAYGTPEPGDQVLVQPMLSNVVRAGVAFSHDPSTAAPYRIVNWTEDGDTTAATSGKPVRSWQQAALSARPAPGILQPVMALLEELLDLAGGQAVDVEFAVAPDESGIERLWLLQARPLILQAPQQRPEAQKQLLEDIETVVDRNMRPHPFVKGARAVFGVMPDWNPAEIIGLRPRPLALSLYRELITDSIWAYQRHNYGYRNLRSCPLMLHFHGLPYIDVRLSFNSFVPADLDDSLADRLVDYYIGRLLDEPALHDKIEFEIVLSCYSLDIDTRQSALQNAGFSDREMLSIKQALRRLTNNIIDPKKGLWMTDAAKLDTLERRRNELFAADTTAIDRIYWLLEDTKRYGTLPFAGLARAGFVAVQLLRSLEQVGIFTSRDTDLFMQSVSTVTSRMTIDRAKLAKPVFLQHYGHLRPGTYDINSLRYDEAPDFYFDWSQRPEAAEAAPAFMVSLEQMRAIANLLEHHELSTDPVGLFDFMHAGIEMREQAKFAFTRNLSDILSLLQDLGEQHGFSRDELSYCDIGVVKELQIAALGTRDVLARSIESGYARYQDTLKLSLPPLLQSTDDIWGFEYPGISPNFITQGSVTAPVGDLDRHDDLAGKIVCIPNADPGFDWLFSRNIAGLITAWGGSNSHMAIRAGELGMPSVIGAGEANYTKWEAARVLHINCAGKLVDVIE